MASTVSDGLPQWLHAIHCLPSFIPKLNYSSAMTSTIKIAVNTVSSIHKHFSTSKPADLVIQDTIALQTILQMLSLIKKADLDLRKPENVFLTLTDETQTQVLKVLSALAAVLVKEHETVAVVAKRDNDLELLNFIVTINPQKDAAPDGPQTYPTILETMWSDHCKEPMLDEL